METCTTLICRYLNTGNGYVVYSSSSNSGNRGKDDEREAKFVVGTGFDKVVLQLAMRGMRGEKGKKSKEAVAV